MSSKGCNSGTGFQIRRDGPVTAALVAFGVAFGAAFGTAFLAAIPIATSLGTSPAWGQEQFMGVEVDSRGGARLVMKSVNVRSKPDKKSNRVAKLKKGDRVEAVGRIKGGGWTAVRRDGKNLGFVYSPVLMPLINGKVEEELQGRTRAGLSGGASCLYTIRFEGRGEVANEDFTTADYEVEYRCVLAGKDIVFTTPMFITEAPYQLSAQNPLYQISIDILEVEEGYDEIFSTTFMYDLLKDQVVFDSTTLKTYGKTPAVKERPAANVAEALIGAVEMAVGAWTGKVWEALFRDRS